MSTTTEIIEQCKQLLERDSVFDKTAKGHICTLISSSKNSDGTQLLLVALPALHLVDQQEGKGVAIILTNVDLLGILRHAAAEAAGQGILSRAPVAGNA